MGNIKLSILELGERDNIDSLQNITSVIEYAQKAEELGFHRFWLAEHHFGNEFCYTSPELLLMAIAGSTERMRIGSAGSITNFYSSYEKVSQYKLLNNLFDDRIDYGVSKGHIINRLSETQRSFLNIPTDADHETLFNQRVSEISELIYNETALYKNHGIVTPPLYGRPPRLFYLSSSYNHFDKALDAGMNYCRSFIHGKDLYGRDPEVEKLKTYREKFYDRYHYTPEVVLALGVKIIENGPTQKIVHNNMQILETTLPNLRDLLIDYKDQYYVDDFVIYDIERNNEEKIQNLSNLSEELELWKQHKYSTTL